MKDKKTAVHGGNIYKKARDLGIPEGEILDFSANISPLGLPLGVKNSMIEAMDGLIHYPDPDCVKLAKAIAGFDHVKENQILCGNGGADLLFRLALAEKPKRVLLPVPAFVEYEEAFRAVDSQIEYFYLKEDFRVKDDLLEAMSPKQALLVLCNPNNPTGLLVERDLLLSVLEQAAEYGIRVLVDECFLELYKKEADYTLKEYIERYPNLILLKSFTKMYAIPGVRLGYVISGDASLLQKMKRCGQAWSVSHFAQAAGVAALSETKYRADTIQLIEEENRFLKREMAKLPIKLYDGVVNYLFFRAPGFSNLHEEMEKKGILIRHCDNYEGLNEEYYRVAVRNHRDNVRLLEALSSILKVSGEQELLSAKTESREEGYDWKEHIRRNQQESAAKGRGGTASLPDGMPSQCKSCTVAGCGGSQDEQPGCTHIYYGPGKGKHQMALGAALHGAEAGYKVLMYRFVRTKNSVWEDSLEEHALLKKNGQIHIEPSLPQKRFIFMMDDEEKTQMRMQNDKKLEELMKQAQDYDLLVLEDALYALEMNILSEEKLLHHLKRKPFHLELILTGRTLTKPVEAMAEFVTEVTRKKDTLETGVSSRLGIE